MLSDNGDGFINSLPWGNIFIKNRELFLYINVVECITNSPLVGIFFLACSLRLSLTLSCLASIVTFGRDVGADCI